MTNTSLSSYKISSLGVLGDFLAAFAVKDQPPSTRRNAKDLKRHSDNCEDFFLGVLGDFLATFAVKG